ncbi:MAG: lytic transglycosylase domain-containing protein [Candidatus Acidiferrales bacterium]
MNPMKFCGTICFAVLAAALMRAPGARADYAVLRSGLRLHITGYETTGDHVRLTVPGGEIEVASAELVSVEPEETFGAIPAATPNAAAPYGELIRAAAAKHGLDATLITRLIAAESNFNPQAVSRRQALGLMQLLPKTAAQYSVANVFDPAQNIEGGTHYLKDLLEKYRGNLSLALAAYNAGPDMVERYGGIPPFPETQNYVKKIASELAQTAPSLLRK